MKVERTDNVLRCISNLISVTKTMAKMNVGRECKRIAKKELFFLLKGPSTVANYRSKRHKTVHTNYSKNKLFPAVVLNLTTTLQPCNPATSRTIVIFALMKNALLWRIVETTNDPALVSYLFGTMHVRDIRAFGQLEKIERCLAECAVFATEFDFSDLDQTVLGAALELPQGLLLYELLGKNAWKRLQHLASRHPMLHPAALRHEHPMRVSAILSAGFMEEETPWSLDETLWNSAKSLGLETTGVETFAEQVQILRSITLEEHVENLRAFLKHQKTHKQRVRKMMEW